ncbi:MAG: DUF523 domain-containing protein [Clostridia bacterium]|nr:DUF523 domain-containing protein [Clostridia bacterium]
MGAPKYLISACLCGEYCRYDGGTFDYPALRKLAEDGIAIPYCPEHQGGLPIPRKPCEIVGDRVLAADGTDCTAEYTRGAEGALALCREHGLIAAILKESSPSCGSHLIYDGTHMGCKIPGMGLTARLLSEHGIALYTEKELPDEIK